MECGSPQFKGALRLSASMPPVRLMPSGSCKCEDRDLSRFLTASSDLARRLFRVNVTARMEKHVRFKRNAGASIARRLVADRLFARAMATGSATAPTVNLTFPSMGASKRAVTGSSATSTPIQKSTSSGTGVTPNERTNVRSLGTVTSAQLRTELIVNISVGILQQSMGDAERMPLFDAQILSRKERLSERRLTTTRWWRTRRSCTI